MDVRNENVRLRQEFEALRNEAKDNKTNIETLIEFMNSQKAIHEDIQGKIEDIQGQINKLTPHHEQYLVVARSTFESWANEDEFGTKENPKKSFKDLRDKGIVSPRNKAVHGGSITLHMEMLDQDMRVDGGPNHLSTFKEAYGQSYASIKEWGQDLDPKLIKLLNCRADMSHTEWWEDISRQGMRADFGSKIDSIMMEWINLANQDRDNGFPTGRLKLSISLSNRTDAVIRTFES
jgi:hypothetical protein